MKKLIVIAGPTASGKTDIAIQIAMALNTEIVSADSRQVFRELSIGAAKPGTQQLNKVKHHFINHISITESYNAGRYGDEAVELITKLHEKFPVLIVTGGSGLYIDALLYGFDEMPPHDELLREEILNKYKHEGLYALQEEIMKVDPTFAANADMHNPQRLMRALEVYSITGIPYSQLRKNKKNERNFTAEYFCLDLEREVLYDRINKRVDTMIEQGLVEEVSSLLPYRHLNALQTVGYKEVFKYFNGESSLDETIELIKKNTRNYAKRQLTWYRKNKEIKWITPEKLLGQYIK